VPGVHGPAAQPEVPHVPAHCPRGDDPVPDAEQSEDEVEPASPPEPEPQSPVEEYNQKSKTILTRLAESSDVIEDELDGPPLSQPEETPSPAPTIPASWNNEGEVVAPAAPLPESCLFVVRVLPSSR